MLFFVCVIILSALMHLHVFNRDLVGVHVWRQSQTQINIENFAFNDFNILNTKSYSLHHPDFLLRYEFPLMQWIFACFYKLFGNHIIISRVLTFLIGIFSVVGMYKLLKSLFNNSIINLAGAWAFCFSPVFYYYIVNPLPDNLALCTGIWSLYYFFSYINKETIAKMLLSFLFLSLAVLSKLPFVIYAVPWLIYFIRHLKKQPVAVIKKSVCMFIFLFPAGCWYLWVISGWKGNGILTGFMGTENTGIMEMLNILQANLVSTLPELLLNYGSLIFFITGLIVVFRFKLYKTERGMYLASLGMAVIAYFIFEMNMIGTVHDYYLFPFLPLLFILVGFGFNVLMKKQSGFVKGFAGFCLIILPITAFLRINDRWNTKSPGFNKDLYSFKTEFRNSIPDDAFCIAGNDRSTHIWPYYLHRKCWSFTDNTIKEEVFVAYCNMGAKYLVSDSRELEAKPFVQSHLKGLVIERGSIKVFELSP